MSRPGSASPLKNELQAEGAPAIPLLNLAEQYREIRTELDAALRRVFERHDFILGPEVEELEREVARLHGCSHGIGCASGSDALLLALQAAGVRPGDGVLVPAFTFFATASAVTRAGAVPIFADVDPRTLTMDLESVERAFGGAAVKPRALLPVHLFGQCADMDALQRLAERHGLFIIEDAAQAILATYRGRPAGSMGVAGCFSFYPTKNLGGAGDGGMIVTNDTDVAERLRRLRNHGSLDRRVYPEVGINSRLDTLQAAILLVKLRHLERWTRLRREKAARYRQLFATAGLCDPKAVYPTADAPVVLPRELREGEHVYHQFTIRAHRRDELAAHLAAQGISTAVFYAIPLHLQPVFATLGYAKGGLPESERASKEALSIPLYPELSDEQQDRVVDQIAAFYSRRP